MSGSDCCTPKDGRHRREFYSLLLFIQPQAFVPRELVCSEGAVILTAFRSLRSQNQRQHCWWVILPILFEVWIDGFEGDIRHNNSFFYF